MKLMITGASSGIGEALARQAATLGHEVWGVARREERLEHIRNDSPPNAFQYSVCDITDNRAVRDAYAAMLEAGFLPDVVILNAAIDIDEPYPLLSMELARSMLRTNAEGALIWVTSFIEQFLERDAGQFVAIGSLLDRWPDPSSIAYAASKASLRMAFRGLRLRYRRSNVAFKTVCLGPVNTAINPRFGDTPDPNPSPWIASPEATARYLLRAIASQRSTFYYPPYMSILCGLFGWLPDSVFDRMTNRLRR